MDRIVREMDMPVDNGFQEIYINASADDGADIADLMKIFTVDNEYDDERFPATSKIKRRFKETDEGVNKISKIIPSPIRKRFPPGGAFLCPQHWRTKKRPSTKFLVRQPHILQTPSCN